MYDPTKNNVQMEIDLSLVDFQQGDTTQQLRDFFQHTALPDLIRSSAGEFQSILGNLHTKSHTDIKGEWTHDISGFHEKISVMIDLQSSQEIDPLMALNHAKGEIAQAIAHHISNCLETVSQLNCDPVFNK